MPEKTYARRLTNVDIFAVGKWNGDTYSHADLDAMVDAFNKVPIKPPLKLGHTEAQKWFGQPDGHPALGWVESLRRVGEKLVADFSGVPDVIANLIWQGNYKKKSAEIYWNYDDPAGKRWPRVLKAVSLLGADLPAVSTLDDLQKTLYGDAQRAIAYDDSAKKCVSKEYSFEKSAGGSDMSDELKKYTEDLKKYLDEIAALKETIRAKDTEIADKVKSLSAMQERAVKAESALASIDETHAVAAFTAKVEGLVKEGKVVPAEKESLILQFVALGGGTKKYGEKEFNPRDVFTKSLEDRKKVIQFEDKGKGKTGSDDKDAEPVSVQVDKLAQKYMSDKKIAYGDALTIVRTEHGELWAEYLKG